MAPRILFVEDEASIAEPFTKALTREGFAVTSARTVAEAIAVGRREPPDLVLLDLGLPDGDGREVARELRRDSEVAIIMLTARDSEVDRVVGLELGADDYVVKPFSSAEVIARIRAVLRRADRGAGAATPADPVELGALRVDPGRRSATVAGSELELTRKEFDLLERLSRAAPRVVTREELMASVWDENWFGSTKTLDVHVAALRRKLGDDAGEPRWLHTVRGVGFALRAAED